MDMKAVVSDNVHSIGYDQHRRVLVVSFKSGGTYEYYDIPSHLYELMLLPHPWRRLGHRVRAHRYRRVAA